MARIQASLDLLEARQAGGQAGGGSGGEGAEAAQQQPTTLDLLLAARDEHGNGLSRSGAGEEGPAVARHLPLLDTAGRRP